ncbi:MAG TPA: phage major capsid protein [Terrisporobacter glycolicus]|uniref:phage major capsid protein n=1 Tax=Terrisporobacter TaxID=1505652 RepID=UPI000E9FF08C|nr:MULTISPECIES: phage major capsid protein [Terrisporobacter]HBI91197.1 phage major capsid protein [Terrisporobacter hibernicus]
MNKEQYIQQRNQLMEEGQSLINEGKIADFNEVKTKIEDLDNKYEEYTKAQANLNSLQDNNKVTNIQNKSVGIVGGGIMDTTQTNIVNEDFTNSMEYRKAFMNYVTKGVAMPDEFVNIDANTKTTDASIMIPTTVLEKIIEKIEATGMILPLVTRTQIKGGVTVPTSSLKPVASWVAEGATSDKQKKTVTGGITFAYYKLRCAVSMSLEMDTIALPIFETTLINNVVEAMTKAVEQAIISGTGAGQPKGILTETAPTGQLIDIAKASSIDYQTLVNAEAALPLAYENGAVWFMTKKTFMAFIGLVDNNKQPIARVNYGINGIPERTLLGRKVILNDYMESYVTTPTTDNKFAFLFNPSDYVLNTNLSMTIKRYEDNNTDDQVTKAIMLVDGKVVDVNSLVVLTHKSI